MIEKLTIEKLRRYKFTETEINDLITNPSSGVWRITDKVHIYASNKKIYSGSDFSPILLKKREGTFPFPYWDKDLIPEYFERKKQSYMKETIKIQGNIFNQKMANEKFKETEIQKTKENIQPLKLFSGVKENAERLELFNLYLEWLYNLDGNLKPKPIRLFYAILSGNVVNNFGSGEICKMQYAMFVRRLNDLSFQDKIKALKVDKIAERLDFHLRNFERNGGDKADWILHTKYLLPYNITPEQKDAFLLWFEKNENSVQPEKAEDRLNEKAETEQEQENEKENNFTLSTIEDWLFEFKENMSDPDYENLVSALILYIDTGIFPKLNKPIQINGRPNIKLFGWALNRILAAKSKGVTKELLQFAKNNISLFSAVTFDANNYLKSNLYKYFTTNTR